MVIEIQQDESPAAVVLRSIAALEGVPETDLEPLYESVDPDALNRLIRHATERERPVCVEFTMEGYTVIVGEDGCIRIYPGDAGAPT